MNSWSSLESHLLPGNGYEKKEGEICESEDHLYEEGTSFLRTCLNGLSSLSGIGVLSIPYALSEGGWFSLALFFLFSAICWYTGILLKRCMDADPTVKTFPDIGQRAFGSKGKWVVAIFLYLEIYFLAIEFLILEGDNLSKLFPRAEVNFAGIRIGGNNCFILLSSMLILPTTWLGNLRLLAYVSASGVLASFVTLFSVLWVGTFDGVGFHGKGRKLFNLKGVPNAVSLYAFCFCGHGMFPTLYTSMKHKKGFSQVLLICFILCTISYGSMAVSGYLMYGEEIQSQITLNLPFDKLSSKIAIYTTLVNPFTKYALVITPITKAIEHHLKIMNKRFLSLSIRTLVVFSTVFVALEFPFFAYLMAFIGSFLSISVSVIFPCLCYLKIFKDSREKTLEWMIITSVIIVGSWAVVVGTYYSVKQIVTQL